MLSQLVYLDEQLRQADTNGDRWIFHTMQKWTEELGLSRHEQSTARKKLVSKGLIREELRGWKAQLYFCVNFDAVDFAIRQLSEPKTVKKSRKAAPIKGPYSLPESDNVRNSQCENPTLLESGNKFAGIRQTLISKEYLENKNLKDSLSPTLSTGQEGERENAPTPIDETPKPKFPQPPPGDGDPVALARSVCNAYPRNAHLRFHELNPGHVTAVLQAIRAEAISGETTQTDAGMMLLTQVDTLAAFVKAKPHLKRYLKPPEEYFRQRQYRLPPEEFLHDDRKETQHGQRPNKFAIAFGEA